MFTEYARAIKANEHHQDPGKHIYQGNDTPSEQVGLSADYTLWSKRHLELYGVDFAGCRKRSRRGSVNRVVAGDELDRLRAEHLRLVPDHEHQDVPEHQHGDGAA